MLDAVTSAIQHRINYNVSAITKPSFQGTNQNSMKLSPMRRLFLILLLTTIALASIWKPQRRWH